MREIGNRARLFLISIDHKIRGHDWEEYDRGSFKSLTGETVSTMSRMCKICGREERGHFSWLAGCWLWHRESWKERR